MTKRLQVLLDDRELAEVQRAARRRRQSVADYVRAALREARATEAGRSASEKLRSLRASTAHQFPTGEMQDMLAEIERGYTERR